MTVAEFFTWYGTFPAWSLGFVFAILITILA